MGATFGFGSEFFVEYLTRRKRFGLRDSFALTLLPKLPGLYSQEMLTPAAFAYEPPRFSGVFLSHIHYDHTTHLQFLDPTIPVHLGAGTKIILDSWQTTSSQANLGERDYRPFRTGQKVNADGVDVEPVHVDHSAPAAYGFLLHTSEGTIVYTGDLRQHGPHAELTKDFIEAACAAKPIALITEGTRVAPIDPRKNLSEAEVKEKSIATARRAKGKIVIATFYPRDVDRMRTFLEVAKAVERRVVLQPKAAHLLLSLQSDPRIAIPDVVRDPDILVYDRQMISPKVWERNLLSQLRSKVVTSDYVHEH